MEILWCGAYSRGRETLLRRLCDTGGVLLTPEQFSHESERILCDIGGDSICLKAEVLTFGRLANRVFSQEGGLSDPVLDEGGRLLTLRLALSEVSGGLTLWNAAARKVSFLESLLSTIDELKRYRITPEILMDASENAEGQAHDRFRDLSLILAAFDRRIGSGAYDPGDTYTRLLTALRDCGYAKDKYLYIDGFLSFTTQEALIVRYFIENGENVVIALPGPPENDGDDRYLASRKLAERLAHWCAHRAVHTTNAGIGDDAGRTIYTAPEMIHLAKYFLSPNAPVFIPSAPIAETEVCAVRRALRLALAPDMVSECRFVASEVLRLAREEHVRYRDIAVLAAGYDSYAEVWELTCEQYEIPLFADETHPVTSSPVYRLTMNALNAVCCGYSREDVFTCLKTGLACLSPEEVYELESYAELWNLRGTHWSGEKDWRFHPDGFGREFDAQSTNKLARLNDMRRRIKDMLDVLRTGEPADALRLFWERLSLRERLQERADWLISQNERRMAMEIVQLWDIYTEALGQCELALEGQKTALSDFAELFALTLSRYKVGVIPVSLDRLTAGDISRVRRREARHVFIMSAAADNVMRVPDAGGLLTDADRVLLEGMGISASPDRDSRAERELTNLYNAMTLGSESLTVTRPLKGGEESGATRQSLIQTVLTEMFGIAETQIDPDEPLLAAYAPARELAALGTQGGKWALLAQAALGARRAAHTDDTCRGEQCSPADGSETQPLPDILSPDTAQSLFGAMPKLSATRLNLLASCGFAHFAQYGLRAAAQRDAGFNALDIGNFAHSVLEQTARRLIDLGGFHTATAEQAITAANEAIDSYRNGKIYPSEHSPRFIWQFDRLSRMVRNLAKGLYDELRVSDFTPFGFELELNEPIRGKVDRLDVYTRGEELFARVVDYKTGKTELSLTEIKHGLGMQMLLYLFALTSGENAARLMDKGIKKVIPAGVLYHPARELLVNAPRGAGAEAIAELTEKELKRSGLILNSITGEGNADAGVLPVSGDDFEGLREHTERVMHEMRTSLTQGKAVCDPYSLNGRTACDYCPYAQACRFDPGTDPFRELPRETKEAFWAYVHENGGKTGEDL